MLDETFAVKKDRPTSRIVVEQSKGSRFQVVGSTDDGAAAAAP